MVIFREICFTRVGWLFGGLLVEVVVVVGFVVVIVTRVGYSGVCCMVVGYGVLGGGW